MFVSATKNFRKKVAKQRNLTWVDAGTFNGDCNRFRFFVAIAYNLFPCPLDLDLSLFPLNTNDYYYTIKMNTIKMKFGQILVHLIKHFSHVFGSILDTRN